MARDRWDARATAGWLARYCDSLDRVLHVQYSNQYMQGMGTCMYQLEELTLGGRLGDVGFQRLKVNETR